MGNSVNNIYAFCAHCLSVIEGMRKHNEETGHQHFIQDGMLIDTQRQAVTPFESLHAKIEGANKKAVANEPPIGAAVNEDLKPNPPPQDSNLVIEPIAATAEADKPV